MEVLYGSFLNINSILINITQFGILMSFYIWIAFGQPSL